MREELEKEGSAGCCRMKKAPLRLEKGAAERGSVEGGANSWLLLVYGQLMSEDQSKREEVRGCLV